jgi:hypothetical protein
MNSHRTEAAHSSLDNKLSCMREAPTVSPGRTNQVESSEKKSTQNSTIGWMHCSAPTPWTETHQCRIAQDGLSRHQALFFLGALLLNLAEKPNIRYLSIQLHARSTCLLISSLINLIRVVSSFQDLHNSIYLESL